MTEAARARLETFYKRYEKIHSKPLTVSRKAYSSDPLHHVRALRDEPPRHHSGKTESSEKQAD